MSGQELERSTQDQDGEKLRLGGMALGNGLLVHGPTHWAAAIRRPDGELRSASGRKPRVRRLDGVPGARGVLRLAEALAVIPLVKRALPEAQLPFGSPRVLATMGGAAAAAAVARRIGHGATGEAAASLLSFAPALLALRGGEVAAYHGVEHKSIAAYEQGSSDAAAAAKEHDRCGSHLVAPLLLCNIGAAALLGRVVERSSPAARAATSLVAVGAAVEIFAWTQRHHSSMLARVLRRPGNDIQRLVGTREPNASQLAVGQAALAEILRAEGVSPATS
ncbi:MAG TPA: DUF1385 domain-containing protein [Solirubrobacteraceae bacterium]|nr:DUF1385 domain-containing protein [Solirubrobacteraceae bacterium]